MTIQTTSQGDEAGGEHDPYRKLLHAAPAPPTELHATLRYLSDAFTLLDDWVLRPDQDAGVTEALTKRTHLETTPAGDIELRHPDGADLGPGYAETYERSEAGAAELRRDVALRAVLRTESRSQWNTWDREARSAEEIRIALRDTPGYYVQCPLDSDDKPFSVLATLEKTLEDEDPNGPRTTEVPVNLDAEHLLQMLATCVEPVAL
jgi:hypothetical protein